MVGGLCLPSGLSLRSVAVRGGIERIRSKVRWLVRSLRYMRSCVDMPRFAICSVEVAVASLFDGDCQTLSGSKLEPGSWELLAGELAKQWAW